jgi:hypothetical protein
MQTSLTEFIIGLVVGLLATIASLINIIYTLFFKNRRNETEAHENLTRGEQRDL